MCLPLNNFSSIIRSSSINIKCLVISMSLDNVPLVGMGSLGVLHNCEPAACMLSTVSDNLTSAFFFIHIDTESLIVGLDNKGHLISILEDLEFLACISLVVTDSELVLIGDDCKGFVVVKDRYDSVVCVGDWSELGGDSLNLSWLLSGLLGLLAWLNLQRRISWNDGPGLVALSVEGPLDDVCAIVGCSSSNIKSLPLREGLDIAGLTSPLSILNWRDLEEATFVLCSIQLDFTSIS